MLTATTITRTHTAFVLIVFRSVVHKANDPAAPDAKIAVRQATRALVGAVVGFAAIYTLAAYAALASIARA